MAVRILCTFPGRYGDLLWALPTVRAISEAAGEPVDLLIAGEFRAISELLFEQPYIASVNAAHNWALTPEQGWQPPEDPVAHMDSIRGGYDHIYHLGYRRWPECPLPFEVERVAREDYGLEVRADLERSWITAGPWTLKPWTQTAHRITYGFSDCWFELKVGLLSLVNRSWAGKAVTGFLLSAPGSRWTTEWEEAEAVDWVEAARRIAACEVFFGDCSALHVLAVALGTPVVLVEPMEARWNPIFYPLGTTGRVRLVTGNDGKPTFDARHCADTLREALEVLHGR